MKLSSKEQKMLRELRSELKKAVSFLQRRWVEDAMGDERPEGDVNMRNLITASEMTVRMIEAVIEGIKNETQ